MSEKNEGEKFLGGILWNKKTGKLRQQTYDISFMLIPCMLYRNVSKVEVTDVVLLQKMRVLQSEIQEGYSKGTSRPGTASSFHGKEMCQVSKS